MTKQKDRPAKQKDATRRQDGLKVLLLNEHGVWIVQCLKYDLAAQAAADGTLKDALEAFNSTYWAQVSLDRRKGIEPFSALGKAPDEYWAMFDRGVPLAMQFELKPPFSMDGNPTIREDVRIAA
jgi:hypothetical protein